MSARTPLKTALHGYRAVSPAERAGFGMVSAFAATIGAARTVNYVRERRRPAPALRSWLRRAYQAPVRERLRIHHFLPGIGLTFAAGAAAILSRSDGRELWLSAPFGTGAGLTFDEIALLVRPGNPYWTSETLTLAQGAVAALAAAGLAARFHRRGAALVNETGPVAAPRSLAVR